MARQRLQFDAAASSPPVSGELAAALADVKRLRQEAEDTAQELDRALERLRRLSAEHPQAEVDEPQAGPVAVPQPLRPVAPAELDAPEEALLRATQLAVEGRSRAEILSTLEGEYAVAAADAGRVVDRILGPQSAATETSPPVSQATP